MEEYIMYLRKSQMDRDYEDISIEETLKRHRKTLTEFCKKKKLNVTAVLEEVVSGESLSCRPQMQKCLEMVNEGNYTGIVCMGIDRLSRGSGFDSGYITQVLQVNNCKIVTPDKTYDLLNESDEQFSDMKFMFSRYELKTITKRLIQGRKMSASEGKFLGSIPPYGYNKEKVQGDKGMYLSINPEQAEVVRMIFRMYAEGKGYNTIVYKLNDLGIPNFHRKRWGQSSIVNILNNEVYLGKIRYGYEKSIKKFQEGQLKKTRKVTGEYDLHKGLHEPIITQEEWDAVKEVQKKKYNVSNKINRTPRNPFAELMYCANCGSVIRRNMPDKNHKHTVPWYRCSKKTRNCDCMIVSCDIVENAVVEKMKEWLSGYIIEVKNKPIKDDTSAAIPVVEKQLADLQIQQEKICELLEQGVYSVQVFQKRNSALEEQIMTTSEKLNKLKEALKQEPMKNIIIPTTQRLLDNYGDMSVKEKNLLWKQVLEKITIYRPSGSDEITVNIYPKLPK